MAPGLPIAFIRLPDRSRAAASEGLFNQGACINWSEPYDWLTPAPLTIADMICAEESRHFR